MSIEIYALSNNRLSSLAEWQRAIDAEGLNLRLPDDTSIDELHGFLPLRAGNTSTGFECDHWDPRDIIDGYSDIEFGKNWTYCLAFRWGSDFDEGLAAFKAAAAYAKATNGIVFDPQDGIVMSPERTSQVAVQMEMDRPKMEEFLKSVREKLRKP